MRPIPFLPQKGALQSHFLFVNLLARALHDQLKEKTIAYIVSPSLTRIQMAFGSEPFAVLELNWSADQPVLFWHPNGAAMPESYEKQLFPAWGQQVTGVWGWIFDRWIEITLDHGGSIWIKWFGRNGNVLYHDGERVHSVFRRSHQGDFQYTPPTDGRIDSPNQYLPASYAKELQSILFVNTEKALFLSKSEFLFWWTHAGVFVDGRAELPVLRPSVRRDEPCSNLLEGFSQFARQYASAYAFQRNRASILDRIYKCNQLLEQKITRLKADLGGLQEAGDYRKQGNSLLTYPELFQPVASLVRLPDCEDPNRMLNIRVDPTRSNIENADRLFAKAKRQHLQREHLQHQLNQKCQEHNDLKQAIDLLTLATDQKQWRKISAQVQGLTLPQDVLLFFKQKAKKETSSIGRKAWAVFDIDSWEVWQGRDARANAELLRMAHKNDIWMHARGHAGSHVLIRSAGRPVPQNVLLQAARLAALNSKGRGEEVCAISYTQRKFVRSIKGGPPGKVVLDREEVIFSHRSDPAPS
ncbi:MAG: NFACT RNA binding domain-containing protein [Bacteroidia bacterium]|jgi:predicted ribosome quality control (RQC) complex YloA/Tae2 family protein